MCAFWGVHIYVGVYAWLYMGAYPWELMWTLGAFPHEQSMLFLEARFPIGWPRDCLVDQGGWPKDPRDLLVSVS